MAENGNRLEDKTFLWLVIAVSVAFAWIIAPMYGAILWGIVIAILFSSIHRRILGSIKRPNIAALAAVSLIVIIVVLPLTALIISVGAEASDLYEKIQSGQLNLGGKVEKVFDSLPPWASNWLNRFGVSTFSDVKQRIAEGAAKAGQTVLVHAINIGQSTFDFFLNLFVMLYLLFFLFRDGKEILGKIRRSAPLREEHKNALINRVAVVVRATVKGNMVIALLQGGLGGVIFGILGIQGALLWGVVMAILSLLPAVGAVIVWLPVAIYLLSIGAVGKGIILILFGSLVIGLVDNLVRPLLVGKDTKMADYLVLLSTLGGIAVMGVNGFVIGPLVAAMFISVWEIYTVARIGRGAERAG